MNVKNLCEEDFILYTSGLKYRNESDFISEFQIYESILKKNTRCWKIATIKPDERSLALLMPRKRENNKQDNEFEWCGATDFSIANKLFLRLKEKGAQIVESVVEAKPSDIVLFVAYK